MYKCGCSRCGRKITLKEELFGRKLQCKCGHVFRAPQKPQANPKPKPTAQPIVDSDRVDPLELPSSKIGDWGDIPASPNPSAKFQTRYNSPGKFSSQSLAPPRPNKKPKTKTKVITESNRQSSGNSIFEGPIIAGLAMMLGATVWFVLGWMAGYIFFYPPILFVIGLGSVAKGLMD